ncbi:hypothetical protein MLD38_011540 [Melastoma candidum]|uniref:Uncharacterized protein n=1 Tax=Melastoma candidum TaxID=119954 RepID=A0ACB9R7I3_9MYRT|nr:hypothetical protein MLD38_011540 [Melastoma candidum]
MRMIGTPAASGGYDTLIGCLYLWDTTSLTMDDLFDAAESLETHDYQANLKAAQTIVDPISVSSPSNKKRGLIQTENFSPCNLMGSVHAAQVHRGKSIPCIVIPNLQSEDPSYRYPKAPRLQPSVCEQRNLKTTRYKERESRSIQVRPPATQPYSPVPVHPKFRRIPPQPYGVAHVPFNILPTQYPQMGHSAATAFQPNPVSPALFPPTRQKYHPEVVGMRVNQDSRFFFPAHDWMWNTNTYCRR